MNALTTAIAIALLALVACFAAIQLVLARRQRHAARLAIRRAFPAGISAFRGQTCTATGTAFHTLSASRVTNRPTRR